MGFRRWDRKNLIILLMGIIIIILAIAITAVVTYKVAMGQNASVIAKVDGLQASNDEVLKRIANLPAPKDGADGYTPKKDIDYRDGKDSVSKDTTVIKEKPTSGKNGSNGTNGLSAYEIAMKHGFVGTEEQWLASLKGTPGIGVQLQVNASTGNLETKRDNDDFWTVLMPCGQLVLNCKLGAL